MALVDIAGLSGGGCTGLAGEDGVGGCTRHYFSNIGFASKDD